MTQQRKNKIDSAVDEVLESKRIRQGFGFVLKTIIWIALFSFALLIIGVAAGVIR